MRMQLNMNFVSCLPTMDISFFVSTVLAEGVKK